MSDYPPPPPPPPPPPGGGGGYPVPPPPPGQYQPPAGPGYVPPPPPGGYPPGGYPPGGYMPGGYGYAAPRTDGLAIASLIVGILSLVCFFVCLGILAGPAAAIMGFISRQRIATSGGSLSGGTMALAGLILGVIGFLVSVIWFFLGISGSLNFGNATPSP